ncbi:hypothetical protein EUGRSUZ_E02841 [Eucalyptus grandis]|uniref:Uncharacterized protein n=2 Tax=Eucalyptus grandis TaxID=71139 RepID=A0ACC3KYH9_EUCGR|nr:hypothetical protein EUGRSUZ_E02841 [Eucalyptus grandis]
MTDLIFRMRDGNPIESPKYQHISIPDHPYWFRPSCEGTSTFTFSFQSFYPGEQVMNLTANLFISSHQVERNR